MDSVDVLTKSIVIFIIVVYGSYVHVANLGATGNCDLTVIWYMVNGIWYIVYCMWCMVYGILCMVYCVWYMVYGIWYMVYGIW